MKPAKLPVNETERLAKLNELEILDTEKEQLFDDFTYVASVICNAPISLVSLVNTDRQWFKSSYGLEAKETPREFAFCAHAILEQEILYVPNSSEDDRFNDNPLVIGAPHVKFYVGIPLTVDHNSKIGTLCVIDNKPRELSDKQISALKCLARQIEAMLNHRLALKRNERTEKELTSELESKSLFMRTQEAARIGSWVVDLKSKSVIWSKMTYEIHELDTSCEIKLEDGISYYIEEHRPIIKALVEKCIEEKKSWDAELMIKTAKNNMRWVRAIGYPVLDKNEIVSLVGTFQDITESKDFKEKIYHLNQRLTLALSASNVGIWEWNIKTKELIWDKQMYALYGIKEEDSIGAYFAWKKGLHPEDKEKYFPEIQAAINNKTKFSAPFRVLWPSGQIKTIRALGEAIYDENGEPLKIIGVNWDISESVLKEEQFAQEKQKAENALKSRSAFFANMSHEIRTPLNGIIGFTSLLMNENLPPTLFEAVKNIKDCGDSLGSLINDILDIAKIDAGKLELEFIPVNIDELLKSVFFTFQKLAAQKGLDLFYVIDKSVPLNVMGDPLRIRQVLFNLIGNSIKFTDIGKITINVKVVKKIEESFWIEFNVKDTGIGIPQESLGHLFKSFEQVDSSTTRKYGGTGLGLSICKNLVSLMDGEISAESKISEGATFRFNFKTKVADQTIITEEIENAPTDLPTPSLKILIVDDSVINVMLMEKFLKNLGYNNLKTASNGLEAVNLIKEHSLYDLIFMDVQMPIMDGLEATKIIREKLNYKTTIVGLSANAFAEDKIKAVESGMDSYLEKPLKLDTLRQFFSTLKKESKIS